ncbi:hypothetical protein PFLUV_G00068690 [Perca fluviatilis]|uniref:Uncharacterized protein n=1 Tax=Perca fluviatilis TaxID=8168 RepID=A0A6A5EI71_PERFL|nr:hypothetical protein PFLUV_G00068690 [Perca fluviatilis]
MALLTFIQSLEINDHDLQMKFGKKIVVVSFVDPTMNYKSYSLLEIVYRLLKSVRINGEMLGRVLLKKLLSLLYRAGLWLKRKFHCFIPRDKRYRSLHLTTELRHLIANTCNGVAAVQPITNELKRRYKRVEAALQTSWSGVANELERRCKRHN